MGEKVEKGHTSSMAMHYLTALLLIITLAIPATSTDASTSSGETVPETSFQQVAAPGASEHNKPPMSKQQYEAVMAKMQKLSDKLAAKEKYYAEKSEEAEAQEAVEKQKEMKEVAMVDAMMPASAPVAGVALVEEKDTGKDVLVEAMKHHEVDDIITEVEQEHKGGTKAVSQALLKRQEEAKAEDAKRIRDWTALQYGYTPLPGEMKPDENKVIADAHVIELNLEADGKTHLSQGQKDQILAATREHVAAKMKMSLAKMKIKRMNQLVEQDELNAKKESMVAEAEQMYAEKDAMNNEVSQVEHEADALVSGLP